MFCENQQEAKGRSVVQLEEQAVSGDQESNRYEKDSL